MSRLPRRAIAIATCLAAACNPTSVGSTFDASPPGDVAALAEAAPLDTAADDAGLAVDVPAVDIPGVDAPSLDVPPVDVPAAVDVPVVPDAPTVDVPPTDVPPLSDVPATDGATPCRSSRECSALDRVCDPVRMLCVECVGDVDCPTGQLCNADAVCRPPRCTAGPSECASATRVRTCDPRVGFVEMTCPAGSTCAAGRCQARVCTPNAVECASTTARRVCNTDGSAWITTACPAAPNAAGRCAATVCATACNAGFADCNGVASDGCEVDTRTSPAHCGACGSACGAGASCSAGACGCAAGTTRCSGRCVDLQTDASNCGGCALVCPSGATCIGGTCSSLGCGGLTLCGGTCVDTRTSLSHCGGCGLACATSGASTASIACLASACAMTCNGSNYDVDGLTTNGCEVADDTLAGHTQATATARGSQSCSDSTTGTITGGRIVSDGRTHLPAPDGFSSATGSAPDWYSVQATGGSLCANNYSVTITTSGGSPTDACYRVTFITNRTTVSMTVSGSGGNTMSSGALGLYDDNTTVYFRVEKTCPAATRENVSYTLSYSL